jgi:putative exporter of polyketide antibiotics
MLGIEGDEKFRNVVEYLAMLFLVGAQFQKKMIRDEKKAEAAWFRPLPWTLTSE